jgi:hypothetical protein
VTPPQHVGLVKFLLEIKIEIACIQNSVLGNLGYSYSTIGECNIDGLYCRSYMYQHETRKVKNTMLSAVAGMGSISPSYYSNNANNHHHFLSRSLSSLCKAERWGEAW